MSPLKALLSTRAVAVALIVLFAGWGGTQAAEEQVKLEVSAGEFDFGDAPEGVIAYPVEGVVGMFPTCVGVGPASWIEHSSTGTMYFGAKVDVERDGNGGNCPTFAPDLYNKDESVSDGDAGLTGLRAYTIRGNPGSQTVSALTFSGLESIGNACIYAIWGSTIDIEVHNNSVDSQAAYVNVLFDWNHDGVWEGSSQCGNQSAPEHVLVNFRVPNGYNGRLSALGPASFRIGPVSGHVWARFSITERPVGEGWNGDGIFADGETEDYLLYVRPALQFCTWDTDDPHAMHWAQLPDLLATGIDVDLLWSSLADDFNAAQNGPLTGVHFWGSFKDDILPAKGADDLAFEINIYSSRPADSTTPWSRPDTLLWTRQFRRSGAEVHEVTNNILEGWFEPATRLYRGGNHKRTFRYGICIEADDDPFIMRLGTTYWIEIKEIPGPDTKYQFGWKTSRRELQFGGNAVWRNSQTGWVSLVYPDGHQSSGRAMDLAFVVTGGAQQEQKDVDFGDAPDPTYSTLLVSDGARHTIVSSVYLGRGVDGEANGQPNATATGDDVTGDDEDGVLFVTDLVPGEPATLQVTASRQGALNAWIDWNADGDWDDADEQIAVDRTLSAGVNTLTIDVSSRAVAGRTFARFRFSTARGLRHNGLAPDGEVEDYQVEVTEGFVPLPPPDHLKWSQPPIEQNPGLLTPVYCGWDEPAYASRPMLFSTASWKLLADNFRCVGDMPVTSVHWWGSYEGWRGERAPGVKPEAWRIGFWSNARADPPSAGYPFARPDKLLWVVSASPDRVQEEKAGIDEFPQRPSDTAFRYLLTLKSAEYFRQDSHVANTQDRIFWISITAVYTGSPGPQNPWGWKTRPRPWADGAVKAEFRRDDIQAGFALDPATAQPIANSLLCEFAAGEDKYDLAFELDTDPAWIKWEQPFTGLRNWPYYEDEESLAIEGSSTAAAAKWTQLPDTTGTGVDVDITKDLPPTWPTTVCADDLECKQSGPITGITLWASWYQDILSGGNPENATFTLSIRQDIAADRSSTGYSMPGTVLWRRTFSRGEFTVEQVGTGPDSYFSPANSVLESSGRVTLYKYTFKINSQEAFRQAGTAKSPIIYWLTAQAQLVHAPGSTATRLGWRTSTSHWPAPTGPSGPGAAAWVKAEEPYDGTWNRLTYPKGHSLNSRPIDLAFAIETEQAGEGATFRRIVADDFRCSTSLPITGITWWGSYLGYGFLPCSCQPAFGGTAPRPPDYFLLSLWSDVPDADWGDSRDFAHPGRKLWEYKAESFDEVLVGFDRDPKPTSSSVQGFEPVYRYTVPLPENRWFRQDGENNILWLSVVAVYRDAKSIVYPWGWTNHPNAAWDLQGLVPLAHWKFDETTGAIAADSSGNGNHGTVVGNPIWRPSSGWLGGALDFVDGRGDYVKVEKPKGLNFAPNSFSVSAWIYPRETRGRWHAILEYDRNSLNGNRFGLWLDVEGRFHFRVGQNTWQSPEALAPNQWYHLTATFDGGTRAMKLYVDGVLEATATNQKGFVTPMQSTLIIGARGSADDEFFVGLIDDVRVFQLALTAEEVLLLAGGGANGGAVAADMSTSASENWRQLLDPTGLIEDMSFMLFTQSSTAQAADEGSGEIIWYDEQ